LASSAAVAAAAMSSGFLIQLFSPRGTHDCVCTPLRRAALCRHDETELENFATTDVAVDIARLILQ